MTKLSVNVNKIATLRNSRGKNNPDVLTTTKAIVSYGAQGITVHPRPDGRHIRQEDVLQIAETIPVELNIEGYPDAQLLALLKTVRPAQCTLVPDPPHVLTSNAGWRIAENLTFLQDTITFLHQHGIRSSLFVDPYTLDAEELTALRQTGTDRVELYTEAYADAFDKKEGSPTLKQYQLAADSIHQLGIDLNAGHDLNLMNLRPLIQAIPYIKEVSIGHALICDALEFGLQKTISRYLACLC